MSDFRKETDFFFLQKIVKMMKRYEKFQNEETNSFGRLSKEPKERGRKCLCLCSRVVMKEMALRNIHEQTNQCQKMGDSCYESVIGATWICQKQHCPGGDFQNDAHNYSNSTRKLNGKRFPSCQRE